MSDWNKNKFAQDWKAKNSAKAKALKNAKFTKGEIKKK